MPRTTFDLVEEMHYLYIRVVKAKELPGNGGPDPFVEIKLDSFNSVTNHFEKNSTPKWNQVFAILKEKIQSDVLEVLLRDKGRNGDDDLIGMVVFDVNEVPSRGTRDSQLAPEWHMLENKEGRKVTGELMLAIWIGTQTDEAFLDAWHLDAPSVSGDGVANIKSKVYLSPTLWYLRLNVIEAQEIVLADRDREQPEVFVTATLGDVVLKTKISQSKNLSPSWNEDLMFAVAEPLEDQLVLSVEDKVGADKVEVIGRCVIPVHGVEKRIDLKTPVSRRWYNLERHTEAENGQGNIEKLISRIYVRISLDGGYHVVDELIEYSSDRRPTAKKLWKPPIGVLEVGILGARELSLGSNAYCVAKYGPKWARTRTILNSSNPRWNEKYTWDVFDQCMVITICVFDNCHLQSVGEAKDSKIGKIRIRLSTLEIGRVYRQPYPLIVLLPSGVKKMGEMQLAFRFSCKSFIKMLQLYTQLPFPDLHYTVPLTNLQLDTLRHQVTRILAARLGRAEPPLRTEVVEYVLDVGSDWWSIRRSRANYQRIITALSGLATISRLFSNICTWKNPFLTVLCHLLFILYVFYPIPLLSIICLILLLIGCLKYRGRPRHPLLVDIRLSQADSAHPDEVDEEFDTYPTSRQDHVVKRRYDRLRTIASHIQNVAGFLATQAELLYHLLSWRDRRATGLFLTFCAIASVVLYVTPSQVVVLVMGLYMMRHPRFRSRRPSLPIRLFKRLPTEADSLM